RIPAAIVQASTVSGSGYTLPRRLRAHMAARSTQRRTMKSRGSCSRWLNCGHDAELRLALALLLLGRRRIRQSLARLLRLFGEPQRAQTIHVLADPDGISCNVFH